MAYAAKTSVPVEKSRAEIESILQRYGADQFCYGRDDSRGLAKIEFRAAGRSVRFVLVMPSRDDDHFHYSSRGKRSPDAACREWEQACRQRWRALALCIKAKLEAVESNISEFEDEFLAHVVIPGGMTTAEWLRPQLKIAYETGRMPSDLLALPAPSEAS